MPARWVHDFALCVWRFYNTDGRQVGVVTDEAYSRAGFAPRDIVLATS